MDLLRDVKFVAVFAAAYTPPAPPISAPAIPTAITARRAASAAVPRLRLSDDRPAGVVADDFAVGVELEVVAEGVFDRGDVGMGVVAFGDGALAAGGVGVGGGGVQGGAFVLVEGALGCGAGGWGEEVRVGAGAGGRGGGGGVGGCGCCAGGGGGAVVVVVVVVCGCDGVGGVGWVVGGGGTGGLEGGG